MSNPFYSASAIADRPTRRLLDGKRIAVNIEYDEPALGPARSTAGLARATGFGLRPTRSVRPLRVRYAAEALVQLAGDDDVRFATPDEIATWHVGGAA
ncbi:hypothetical protein AB0C34_23365 [Nocardia sp. NPDC049220]|uniref:hypothetical protein n=1 Tax=Nocardia sp. NPDC049220 TaxID=3155273 RepID=UPI003402A817